MPAPVRDTAATSAADEQLVPEGTRPPHDVPPDIFDAALAIFLNRRRLDMRALARELGMSRATLYRRVAGRDHLLGSVVWFLTRHAMVRAARAGTRLRGRERLLAIIDHFMRDIHDQPAFQRLLDSEPEAALRVLTSSAGPIQPGITEVVTRLLDQERSRGALRVSIDHATLAYVIVRIGESFLYADVIADNEPDVGRAVEVIGKLLLDDS